MGHVKPGRKAARPQRDLTDDQLWPVWRALVRDFRFGRFMWQMLNSRGGWGFYDLDLASSLLKIPAVQEARMRLSGASPDLLDRLAGVAAVNARRSEALWKAAALFYITVPVTLTLATLQAAPEFMRVFLATSFSVFGVATAIATLCIALQMLFYFGVYWRASQIVAVIDLVKVERPGPPTPPSGGRP